MTDKEIFLEEEKNYVKIDENNYCLETTNIIEQAIILNENNYVEVDDEEFNRLFLLYQDIWDGKVKAKDIIVNKLNLRFIRGRKNI